MSIYAVDHEKRRAIAESAIAGSGVVLTFEVRTKTPDPTTGATDLGLATSVEWTGSTPSPYELRYIDGVLIQAGDMRTTISAKDITFTPQLGQKVTFDSATWRIMHVRPRNTGPLLWGYTLHLRRG